MKDLGEDDPVTIPYYAVHCVATCQDLVPGCPLERPIELINVMGLDKLELRGLHVRSHLAWYNVKRLLVLRGLSVQNQ
jgi:hypothetical protein